MASAIACKGAVPAGLLKSGAPMSFCALHSPAVTADRRPYSTQVKEASRYDDDDDDYYSAVACKGAAPASLLKSGAPVAFCALHSPAVTADRRAYNTQVKEVSSYDDDDDYSGRDHVIPSFFSQDVLDPLGAPMSMGRLLSLMKTGLSSTAGASRLGRWVAKEDDDAVYLKVPMPGLTKEHVTVRADKNILVIKGEGEKQPWDGDDDSAVPRYNRRIEMPADAYKMDMIKAEMKNGVLWVTLLKVKEEERKDVFHVKVE